MREMNLFALALEFVLIVIGIIAGFQISEWGEQQAMRELAAQNVARAIAEAEHNVKVLERVVSRLESEFVPIDSLLSGLIECDDNLTQQQFQKFMLIADGDFLPSLESHQVSSLERVEYTPFYSEAFLGALPVYLGRMATMIKGTSANHDGYFNWQLHPAMLEEVTIVKTDQNAEYYRFQATADPGELCKNPQFVKRVWRLQVLRAANYDYYKVFLVRLREFLPVMHQQLASF